jgi:hypothetical protein
MVAGVHTDASDKDAAREVISIQRLATLGAYSISGRVVRLATDPVPEERACERHEGPFVTLGWRLAPQGSGVPEPHPSAASSFVNSTSSIRVLRPSATTISPPTITVSTIDRDPVVNSEAPGSRTGSVA